MEFYFKVVALQLVEKLLILCHNQPEITAIYMTTTHPGHSMGSLVWTTAFLPLSSQTSAFS